MSFLEPGAACRFSSGGWCWAHASLRCTAPGEVVYVLCPKCGELVHTSDDHYVPSVGHMTDPDDAIQPYWRCQR